MKEDRYWIIELTETYPPRVKRRVRSNSARNVAIHMWGRSVGKHLIYKNGKLAVYMHLYPEIDALQKYLESIE